MVATPGEIPVTTPVPDTVATPGEPDVHAPPDGLLVSVAVLPTQTVDGPEIAVGERLTVTGTTLKQPVESV